jgi:hypothetical protein
MSLFIGGLHDGEWHHVERLPGSSLPKMWSMTKRHPLAYSPDYYMRAPIEIQTRADHYELMEFHIEGHHYKVYRHYKLKPHEAFEMLLRGYEHKDLE